MKCKWIRCCPECTATLAGALVATREHGEGRCVVCAQRTTTQAWASGRRSPRGKRIGS